MKKFFFPIVAVAMLFFACKKDENSNTKTVNPNEVFSLQINQTAVLDDDGMEITFLGITEESRCPTNTECLWAGRVIAEFKVEKGGESVIKTLTDNPENDPLLSTSFLAFGHTVILDEVAPYPDGNPIKQKDYVVKLIID
jgi:hypothetical protein